jgi:putative endonuclease
MTQKSNLRSAEGFGKARVGQIGENIACEYLRDKKYKIIDRNYRKPWGEIDIIAKAPDKTLIFVEVKTMSDFVSAELKPEDQLTGAKLKKLQKTARLYAGHYPKLINDTQNWQIDLIAVLLSSRADEPDIKHYENI